MLGERRDCHPQRLVALPSSQQRAGRRWEPLCLSPHLSYFLLIFTPWVRQGRNRMHVGVPGSQRAPCPAECSLPWPESSSWFPVVLDLSSASSSCTRVKTQHQEKMPHHLPGEIHCSSFSAFELGSAFLEPDLTHHPCYSSLSSFLPALRWRTSCSPASLAPAPGQLISWHRGNVSAPPLGLLPGPSREKTLVPFVLGGLPSPSFRDPLLVHTPAAFNCSCVCHLLEG